MHFSPLEKVIWAACLILNCGLFFVLAGRGRWRQFPILTVWMAFMIARTITLFLMYRQGSRLWYTRTWVVGTWLDFLIQLGVVLEIARIVLRPTGTWVRDARLQFAILGLAGILVAAAAVWGVSPPAWSIPFAWELRANLFTSLVICELVAVMNITANRLGLGWRNHVMAVGQGLTAWLGVMVVCTALQSWFGTISKYFAGLDYVREFAYSAAISWMIVQLWRQEPERQPISADLEEYILALHRRVEYDLGRLDARN